MQLKHKAGKSFFQKLAAAFTSDIMLSQIDAKTSEGKNIRIDAANDAPGVGDACYIVDTETDEATPAPDGDYTISGGDYDGYKLTVVDGKVSAIFNPAEKDVEIQQSTIASYKELQKENKDLKAQVTALGNSMEGLREEFKKFKKLPLAGHTVFAPEETEPDKDQTYFGNQPWNKRKKKAS